MNIFERFLNRSAADIAAELSEVDAAIATCKADLRAHGEDEAAAAADADEKKTRAWVQRGAQLRELLEVKTMRRATIAIAYEQALERENLAAVRAQGEALSRRVADALKLVDEYESHAARISEICRVLEGLDEECRDFNTNRMPGVDSVVAPAKYASRHPEGHCWLFWRNMALPSGYSLPGAPHWPLTPEQRMEIRQRRLSAA